MEIIKRCPICEKKERYYNVMVMVDEPNGRRSY
jgi:recombinational DNA repair protein RecR